MRRNKYHKRPIITTTVKTTTRKIKYESETFERAILENNIQLVETIVKEFPDKVNDMFSSVGTALIFKLSSTDGPLFYIICDRWIGLFMWQWKRLILREI